MNKKIRDIYEYIDYRVVLNHDFLARSSGNHGYSLRAYSRDLQLSPSFISDVLRGKRDLSPKKGKQTFEKLGFKLGELDYIEDLIVFQTSKDAIEKQNTLESIHKYHKKGFYLYDTTKDLIMRSVDHFFIHGIVGGEPDFEKILALSEKIGISESRALQVIQELTNAGYFKKTDDQYFIENINLHVAAHKNILEIQRQFVNRLIHLTEVTGGMKKPEQMGHYMVMGFDPQTFPLAIEAYNQLINTLNRLSNQTPVAKRYAFFSSSFFSFPSP